MANATPAEVSADGASLGLRTALPYLPGLDGLRAIAVLAVLVYHHDYSWLPGGFLGVDVFFVLSGYLITALLITEYQRDGRIDLRAFWWRRARRLLPAVFLVIAAVLVYASIFLRSEIADLRLDALVSLGYVTNWWLIFEERSYFEAMGRPSLFQHLWSLAVEEQFYLLWPVIFIAFMRWWRKRLPLVVISGVIASTALMWFLFDPYADPSRIYYGTDTRSAALLMGSLLAFFWRPGLVRGTSEVTWTGPRWSSITPTTWLGRRVPACVDLIGIVAVGMLLTLFWQLSEFDPRLYQGGFFVSATVTATVIAVVTYPKARLMPWMLGFLPLRWLGTRSYGIYLWHWPIFMITRPHLDVPLDGVALFAMRLALTFTLAELSYRLVEAPVRHGALEGAWRRWWQPGAPWLRLAPRRALTAVPVAAVVGFAVLIASVTAVQEDQSLAIAAGTTEPQAVVGAQFAAPPLAAAPTPGFTRIPVVSTSPFDVFPPEFFPALAGSIPPSRGGDAGEEPPVGEGVVAAPPAPDSLESPSSVSVIPPEDREPADEVVSPFSSSVLPPAEGTASPGGTPTSASPGATPAAEPPPDASPVTAIGDSVMLGAVDALAQVMPGVRVDGEVGMQASRALALLHGLHASDGIADLVVIHIGSNGIVRESEFVEMMQLLEGAERVVIVNVKVPRAWEHQNNNLFAKMVRQYSNAVLVDWHSESAGGSDYFWTDGIHLRPEGAAFYASLIAGELQ
jgi:peptidoglycan/LPS O-acetylase OafA/YrhL